MIDMQDGFVEANGLKIHYYRTGGDLPQVVLNHGALDDGLCWPQLVDALADDYDLILPDARGHGLSDSGSGEYSPEVMAGDLISLIETLGLEKPILGGHSMGGITSMYTSALRPDLVAGFFMEDPPITMPGEPLFGVQSTGDGQAEMGRLIRALQLIMAAPRFISQPLIKRILPSGNPEVIESWLDSKKRVSEDFINVLEDPQWLATNLDDDLLPEIKSPALLIYGDREKGAIVSREIAEGLEKRVSGLKAVHIAGATHDIRRTQFSSYLDAVKRFFREVQEAPLIQI
jgi:pimeloyl-ACP methyl ester carboxylesterase